MIRNKESFILVVFSLIMFVVCMFTLLFTENISLIKTVFVLGMFVEVSMLIVFSLYLNGKLKKIANYVRDLRKGVAKSNLADFSISNEGELSILANEINKLAFTLTEQSKILKNEKDTLSQNLSDISHQLKTPITSMTVMLDLLSDDNVPPEKRDEFLDNIRVSVDRMQWLLLSLLKLAKVDSGTFDLNVSETNTHYLITKVAKSLDALFDVSNHKAILTSKESISLFCDINWTEEALSNIVKNCIEHSPENSAITFDWGENPIYSWISVSDEGEGIPSEDLPHLFKRFYKGKNASKNSVGIGLALSLAIMERQNGTIEVNTVSGKGATFILKFYR